MTSSRGKWAGDTELFARARAELFSAVIGDVLDALGRTQQFLPATIKPLQPDHVLAGRAMPVLQTDDAGGEGPGRANVVLNQPFGLMLRALDDLQPDEVYVCAGSGSNYALWGELMSVAAHNRGSSGAVLDGWSRDTRGILALGFPCFSRGSYAQDQRARGKVIDFRCSIRLQGVTINPQDIIFGDRDGVVVVPREMEEEVFRRAWEKANGEKTVFSAIKGGLKATEAWNRYGIL